MTDPIPKAPALVPLLRPVPRARLHLIAEIPAAQEPVFKIEHTHDDDGPIIRVYVERAA